MRTSIARLAALLPFLVMLSGGSASADTVITVTSTGTVSSGFDERGLFGPPNSSLAGVPYTLTMTFDATTAGFSQDATSSELFGGTDFGTMTPGTMTLLVGSGGEGGGGLNMTDTAVNEPGSNFTQQDWTDITTVDGISIDFEVHISASDNGSILADVFNPPPGNLCLSYACAGSFKFVDSGPGDVPDDTFGTLAPTDYEITVPVPEPSAWVLLICGMALTGAALRRRAWVSQGCSTLR